MDLKQAALHYHEFPKPGKLSVESSKPCATQADLSLAYTPGVAEPVRAINHNPQDAYRYTNKGDVYKRQHIQGDGNVRRHSPGLPQR